MTPTDTKEFLQCLNISLQVFPVNKSWVTAKCPLAPWKHDNGTDNTPSFAIKQGADDAFNCYTCEGGSVGYLLQMLQHYKADESHGMDLAKAWQVYNKSLLAPSFLNIPEYGEVKQDLEDVVFSEVWLQSFPPASTVGNYHNYLVDRGLNKGWMDWFDIRADLLKGTVCFPIRNFAKQLVGLRGRYIDPDPTKGKYHVYKTTAGGHTPLAWFGETWVRFDRPILMVESVFDLVKCFMVYPNVVAPLSVGIGKFKAERMHYSQDIVTMFDNGMGGMKAQAKITKYFPSANLKHTLPPSWRGDPGDMSLQEIRDTLKDYLPLSHSLHEV